jgi:toxin ParE1/3/4
VNIVWSPEAIEDLTSLRAYIGVEDPEAARRLAMRIVDAIETLISQNPEIGRHGRVPGTRELAIARTSHITPYRVKDDAIEVLRILHGARRWPERF